MLLYSFFAFFITIISWICVFNGCECVVNGDGQYEEVVIETTFDGIDGLIDVPNLDTFNSKNGQPFDGGNELVYHDEQMELEPSSDKLKFDSPKVNGMKYGPKTDPNFCENFKRAYAEYSKTMKDSQIAAQIYKVCQSKISYWKKICGIEFKLKKKMTKN